jgi:hypothetical protein
MTMSYWDTNYCTITISFCKGCISRVLKELEESLIFSRYNSSNSKYYDCDACNSCAHHSSASYLQGLELKIGHGGQKIKLTNISRRKLVRLLRTNKSQI